MLKINVLVIISDHLSTLYNDRSGKRSYADFLFFYGIPVALGVAFYLFPFPLPQEINTALIAVFSVFGALLFSAQMALYGLSPQPPASSGDTTTDAREKSRYEKDKKYFSDVNFNVSYLILLSCLSLVAFLAMMVMNAPGHVEGAVLVGLVSHFFLTLLMLVKRTHIAFSTKYNAS